MAIEHKVARKLIRLKKTIAIAESCTGGLLTHRLTNISGSSQFLKFGLIAYSNEAKIKFLNVPAAHLKKFGAVSAQTAAAMARGARQCFGSYFGIGITGIAGPTGGSKKNPVGLVFMAVADQTKIIGHGYHFKGPRLQIKSKAATQALNLLSKFLL